MKIVIFGGVAQLGERTVRIRKVESSILFVSTNDLVQAVVACTFFVSRQCTISRSFHTKEDRF